MQFPQHRRVFKFWEYSLAILCLVLLTGCPTPPKPTPRLTPLTTIPQPPSPQITRTNPVPEIKLTPTNPPIAVVKKPVPITGWVSWEDWNLRHGFEKPQRLPKATNLTYLSRVASGVLSVTMGSRMAYWNGLSFTLGFIPQLTNGRPFIHALDATKSFEPLLLATAPPTRVNRVIVIDPGHGGENTGAKSVFNGSFEKDYALDWAMRVRPLLAANGWKVFLTRSKDIDLALSDRVALAEKVKADLFVSLHFNSVGPKSARFEHGGLETYCLTPVGMPSYLTRDYPDDPAAVFPNNAFDTQNLQCAIRLQQAMVSFTQRKDRGVRRARFMSVLRGQNRPAVLLEGGYLTDRQEARLIHSTKYRQQLAEAVANALAD